MALFKIICGRVGTNRLLLVAVKWSHGNKTWVVFLWV
jgi:hypothetical protein